MERTISLIAKELNWLGEARIVRQRIHQAGKVTIYHQDVWPSVVVEISKAGAPLYRDERIASQPGPVRDVRKLVVTLVPIKTRRLVPKPRDENIQLAVAIEVAKVRCHVAVRLTVRPCTGAG